MLDGAALKTLREMLEVSQSDLARVVGVSKQSVSRTENAGTLSERVWQRYLAGLQVIQQQQREERRAELLRALARGLVA